MLAMAEPQERRRFLFGWSAWRRAHQAVAARCRAAKRAARQALGTEEPLKAAASCHPKRRSSQTTVLGGILWVARTGSSWREMPEEFGKWESAYKRHELWMKQGLWQGILRVLGEEDVPGPIAKEPN